MKMMHKEHLSVFVVALVLCQGAFAKSHTPKAGSQERKAIMDALRVPIQKEAKTRPTFIVNYLKVDGGWAFTQVQAVDAKGKVLGQDYMDGNVHALLRLTKNNWKVLVYGSATDTSIIEEAKRKYPNAPKTLYNFG